MYVSEVTFDHLRQAADERLLRELEYRRIARERVADTTGTAKNGAREHGLWFRRSAQSAPRPLSHA